MSKSTLTPTNGNHDWDEAANNAKEAAVCAGEMTRHAASAVGAMASHAACEVSHKADDLTAGTGVRIQELSDRLSRSAPQTGVLGGASQAVTQTVRHSGEYLEHAKLSGMTEDLAVLIRRNPIPAVLIAVGLGWFVGRKLEH